MSKQFRFYATSADIEALCAELRSRVGMSLISESSAAGMPVEINSALKSDSIWFPKENATSVRCFIAPLIGADIKLDFYPTLGQWKVQHASEVIELSGADCDGKVLLVGRMYFQSDILLGQQILLKRPQFLEWADRIFRISKQFLKHSKSLDAYVGPGAETFKVHGGRFVSSFRPDRTPVFAE